MARQVKVFNGAADNTSLTIYTVPAGRVAKVVAAAINLAGGQYGVTTMRIAGEDIAYTPNGYNGYYQMPSPAILSVSVPAGNQLVIGRNMSVALLNGTTASLCRSTYYLTAGQTIQATMGYQNCSASWSFLVIEEY